MTKHLESSDSGTRNPRSNTEGMASSNIESPGSYDVTPTPLMSLSYPWLRLATGLIAVVMVGILAASLGSVNIPPLTILKITLSHLFSIDISKDWPDSWHTILWQLRFPRILLAGIVGGALALSGAAYQGLFRNPLADPYLIGVASGAGLGATIVLLTGIPLQFNGLSVLPLASFTGGSAAVVIAIFIAKQPSGTPLSTLILAGVAIASIASSVTGILMLKSDPDLRPVLSWLMGSLTSAQWNHILLVMPYVLPSSLLILIHGRIINTLQLDEEYSSQLGVNVERSKLILIISATLLTAAVVSYSGLIGFVGLIAPHTVRLIWDIDYRTLMPMASITGAGFLILADLTARTITTPEELPVGIVTALCGGPFFLFLLNRQRVTISRNY